MTSTIPSQPDGASFDEGSSKLIFGKYEIIRRLALGGMGEVFLARQMGVAVDRLVILKSLLPELAEQEGFVDQFLDEARVAATLNHPNIVGIYEVGLWNGQYFIAMEFIHGADLARIQRNAAKKRLSCPYQVSARMVADAALGLDHAHHAVGMDGRALTIVHRDISPQNIMVRGDGVTKVVDFGIAKAANRATRTATGMLKGKLQYMSPEQVAGEEIDARSDQFALGVVLWELTTNRRLFKAENDIKTIERIVQAHIPRPSELVPGFPPDLEQVILRMLEKDRDRRYPRCADVARDLQAYLDACSRTVGSPQVAEFVRQVVGDELDEVTANLTPTKQNFLISLDGTSGPRAAPGSTPTTLTQSMELSRRRRAPLVAAAAALLTVVGGFAAWSVVATDEAVVPEAAPDVPDPPAAANPDGARPDVVASARKVEPAPAPRVRSSKKVVGSGKKRRVDNQIIVDEPRGAAVFVDGKPWPNPVPTVITGLAAGEHRLEFRLPSGQTVEEKVAVVASRVEPPQPPQVKGNRIKVQKPAGAKLLLDGRDTGQKVPATLDNVGPGSHVVTYVLKDDTYEFDVEIADSTAFEIESEPQGATVFLDGMKVGVTPFDLAGALGPGVPGSVRIYKKGYEPEAFEVVLERGKSRSRSVALKKSRREERPEPPPPKRTDPGTAGSSREEAGFFTVRTTPWAKIAIDGEPKGSTPLFKVKLKPGKHTVKLVNEGAGLNVTKTITIAPGETLKQNWTLE